MDASAVQHYGPWEGGRYSGSIREYWHDRTSKKRHWFTVAVSGFKPERFSAVRYGSISDAWKAAEEFHRQTCEDLGLVVKKNRYRFVIPSEGPPYYEMEVSDGVWKFSPSRFSYIVSLLKKGAFTSRSGYILWSGRSIARLLMKNELAAASAEDPSVEWQVDHINWDRMDNRDNNLRVVTPAENSQNTPRRRSTFPQIFLEATRRDVNCWVVTSPDHPPRNFPFRGDVDNHESEESFQEAVEYYNVVCNKRE